jgi:hypothetical protein
MTETLIAPSSIRFSYSKWHKLGINVILGQQIANITRIDHKVLDREASTKRKIVKRMSWASERSISRVEDIAYSFMGIFNVFLPMLYGEGDRASIRLQEKIMKLSEDHTIFVWKSLRSGSSPRDVFVRSPSKFTERVYATSRLSHSLQTISKHKGLEHKIYDPAAITSRGLLIQLPLLRVDAMKSTVTNNNLVSKTRGTQLSLFFIFRSSCRSEFNARTYLALTCIIDSGKGKESQIL